MPRNPRWLVALAAGAAVLSAGPAAASAAPPAAVNPAPFSTVTVDRSTVAHGESFTVSASRYWPNEEVYVRLIPEGRADETRAANGFDGDADGDGGGDARAGRRIVTLAILLANAEGEVSGTVTVPERRGRHHLRGEYRLELAGHGSQLWQSTPFRVIPTDGGGHHKPDHGPDKDPHGKPDPKHHEDAPGESPEDRPEG
ncbi:hypothetical protein [Streptomyces virginiae]|uniref:hypothetical protein n=1 Tax=Streptomyces virginiae TaxID=1961 RepID=UPI002DB5BC4E|nr:hypothetical protein [Streptomyces sp. CMAA1738]MEC4570359.1 hypothetical protein [Streptomyces sp. CMAA1738]